MRSPPPSGTGSPQIAADNAALRALVGELTGALKTVRKELRIRDDFVPLGHACVLAPVIDDALAKARKVTP